jgi:hypothetical protein
MVTDDYRGYQKGVYVWYWKDVTAFFFTAENAEDAEKSLNRRKPRATTGPPTRAPRRFIDG